MVWQNFSIALGLETGVLEVLGLCFSNLRFIRTASYAVKNTVYGKLLGIIISVDYADAILGSTKGYGVVVVVFLVKLGELEE